MEQEPTPIIEFLVLILFLGSITFLLGAIYQGFVLYKNKKSLLTSISVIILTRILTVISSYFIWAFWNLPIDIMFLFVFLPAVLPELILSPLTLKLFGNKIIKFDGCYHGHVDSLLIKAGSGVATFGLPDSPGVPKDLAKYTYTCEYNNKEQFLSIYNEIKDDLAAVIVEPIAGNMGFVPAQEDFLKTLREATSSNNSVLIFDEVMSGFRVSLGGAQEIYNIKPDLTALGKVIGGGLPVGAFGGREEIMNYLAPSGPVYQAGTLSGNPLAMAGGSALLQLLINKNPFQGLEDSASMLLGGMKSIMAESGIPFSVNKIGGMFGFFFLEELPQNINDVSKSDDVLFSNFLNSCIRNGIYFAPSKYEAGFISAMHQDNEINKTLETVKKIIKKGINNEI